MARIVVRRLSDTTKERLRQSAVRHTRSLEAEVRAILERAAQEAVGADDVGQRFPDWFVRMSLYRYYSTSSSGILSPVLGYARR
jgi:hypothetical protein